MVKTAKTFRICCKLVFNKVVPIFTPMGKISESA